jgi:hypothetical protein
VPTPFVVIEARAVGEAADIRILVTNGSTQSLRGRPTNRTAQPNDRFVKTYWVEGRAERTVLERGADQGMLVQLPQQVRVVHVDENHRLCQRHATDVLRSEPIAQAESVPSFPVARRSRSLRRSERRTGRNGSS